MGEREADPHGHHCRPPPRGDLTLLEPEGRQLLLDALRPDPGFHLDLAVGTSYSLDLLALMTAPVAFAMFDRENAEGRLADDPIATLEALRRHADRISLFCQAGQIAVPTDFRSLLVYLENSIHPVVPPNPDKIFHPKVWCIRYRANSGEETRHRLVCLSRNLTFDRSWDTVLRLEGTLPAAGTRAEHPRLGDFIRSLPGLADPIRPVTEVRRQEIDDLADEASRVAWQAPSPFKSVSFWGLGIGSANWPFGGRIDRLLVISPFVTEGLLRRITTNRKGSILVSRPEAFELLGGKAVAHLAENWVLRDDAVEDMADPAPSAAQSDGTEPPTDEAVAEAAGTLLQGLHAKVYVSDEGWHSRIWTGSANATDAAFGGNVEFLVELRGSKEHCGIAAVIGERPGRLGFRKLLEPYAPLSADPRPLTATEEFERNLDRARRAIGGLRFTATCTARDEQAYDVALLGMEAANARATVSFHDLRMTARPITLGTGHSVEVDLTTAGINAKFSLARESLTPFFAIRIASTNELGPPADFLVNATLVGAPEDRSDRVLRDLLKNPADLIRFLLLLLGTFGEQGQQLQEATGHGTFGSWGSLAASEALLEPFVKAFARDPDRLREIAGIMLKLAATEDGADILPPGWSSIWDPIAAALADERA